MTAVVTLSLEGLMIARAIEACLSNVEVYAHQGIETYASSPTPQYFDRILDLTASLFHTHDALVYVTPCGVAVRAIAPHLDHKKQDPAVVVVDVGGRHAISLLSGHEGGANRLTIAVANAIGAEPAISTTTEAAKNIIVGIGCRRDTPKEALVNVIQQNLTEMSIPIEAVRLLATADIKRNETGLIEAAKNLEIPLVLISSQQIRTLGGAFEKSALAQERVGLPAVAEPACMLAGKRTTLIMRTKKCNGITIAMARESCLWSA